MRLLYLISWSTDRLINLSVLGLMCLVWLIMMMTDVYASRRRSSDRCSCRGMHQLDLEGSSLWCCSPWCLPKRGYSGTYTIENNLRSRLTMASKVYNTTITTAVKLIQGMSNNHYPDWNSLLWKFDDLISIITNNY